MIKINLRKTIIWIMISLAYLMFGYFSLHAFKEYQKELTGINQWLEQVQELPLPTITVCSQEVFKNISKNTTTEMVLKNLSDYVFAWEDLFDGFFTGLASRFWNPHREIFSKDLGLCYSLSNKFKANPTNHYMFYIFLPVGKKYQVCIFALIIVFFFKWVNHFHYFWILLFSYSIGFKPIPISNKLVIMEYISRPIGNEQVIF